MINLENVIGRSHYDLNEIADWKALHRLSLPLLKPDTVQQKLERILHMVAGFITLPTPLCYFFDRITDTLAVRESIGLSDAAVLSVGGIKPGQGCCGFTFSEQRRTIIEDFQVNEQFSEFRSWASEHGIRSVYSTPFYDANGEVLAFFQSISTSLIRLLCERKNLLIFARPQRWPHLFGQKLSGLKWDLADDGFCPFPYAAFGCTFIVALPRLQVA